MSLIGRFQWLSAMLFKLLLLCLALKAFWLRLDEHLRHLHCLIEPCVRFMELLPIAEGSNEDLIVAET